LTPSVLRARLFRKRLLFYSISKTVKLFGATLIEMMMIHRSLVFSGGLRLISLVLKIEATGMRFEIFLHND
jgi:hypothetical protein